MQEEAEGPFQAPSPVIVLASGSVTRRTLLAATGLRFTSFSPGVDEVAVKLATRREGGTPEHAAMALARMKAAAWTGSDGLVIGCDQILVCGGMWFDKPASLAMARQHLQTLRGRTHVLVTATVCLRNGVKVWSHLAAPRLTVRPFSPAFLDAYLDVEGEALLSSVGAYRVEGAGVHLFEAIEGEYSAILGLPLMPLMAFLRAHGVVLG
jgi:septum formation protein